jgi:hypothetical protein
MFTRILWNFWPQNVISARTSVIYIYDFHTQSVIFTRSMMLKSTNVITTLTTVISTRTRVISTRRVWCWHVWEWLWHSCELKPHSACTNYSCVLCTHTWTQCSTRTSVIYICRVRFPHAECDCYTQSVIFTRSMMLKSTNVIATLTTVISTRTRVISTRRVWLRHARVEIQLDTCDFKTNQLKLT